MIHMFYQIRLPGLDVEKLAISTNKSDVTLFKRDGSERLHTWLGLLMF